MGHFEFLPFLFGALVPGICLVGVVLLSCTRWRSSCLQLLLSVVTLAYGIIFAWLIRLSSAFSLGFALYGLPTLIGSTGILIWFRSRVRR